MQGWVAEELETSDIGDERLDARFKILLDRLSKKPSVWARDWEEFRQNQKDKQAKAKKQGNDRSTTRRVFVGYKDIDEVVN